MVDCNICCESYNKLIKCFSDCSYEVCEKCIIKLIEVKKIISYDCPQCRQKVKCNYMKITIPIEECNENFLKFCMKNNIEMTKKHAKYTFPTFFRKLIRNIRWKWSNEINAGYFNRFINSYKPIKVGLRIKYMYYDKKLKRRM